LAEALGVSQPTAWRMGHALRLMLARENPLGGTVEIDEFFLGGRPKKKPDEPPPGRGRKGLPRTTKHPVLAVTTELAPMKHLTDRRFAALAEIVRAQCGSPDILVQSRTLLLRRHTICES
jgi:hypothetical protein